MKKAILFVLAVSMVFSLLAGCTGSPAATDSPTPTPTAAKTPEATPTPVSDDPGDGYPLFAEGDITLSIMMSMPSEAATYVTDFLDGTNIVWPEFCRRTGVNLKMILYLDSAYTEHMNLTIASDDLPDIMRCSSYSGGLDQAYTDKVFARLNEYEDIMPNYLAIINRTDADRKAAYTDAGNLMAFSQVYTSLEPGWAGYYVRKDWLDDLGIRSPETMDDWYNMLVSFRDNKTGGRGPLELQNNGVPFSNYFIGAFGATYSGAFGATPNTFVKINDKLIFSATTDGMRSYLETMHKWHSENLIEEDWLNHDNPIYPNTSRVAANQSGAAPWAMDSTKCI